MSEILLEEVSCWKEYPGYNERDFWRRNNYNIYVFLNGKLVNQVCVASAKDGYLIKLDDDWLEKARRLNLDEIPTVKLMGDVKIAAYPKEPQQNG